MYVGTDEVVRKMTDSIRKTQETPVRHKYVCMMACQWGRWKSSPLPLIYNVNYCQAKPVSDYLAYNIEINVLPFQLLHSLKLWYFLWNSNILRHSSPFSSVLGHSSLHRQKSRSFFCGSLKFVAPTLCTVFWSQLTCNMYKLCFWSHDTHVTSLAQLDQWSHFHN